MAIPRLDIAGFAAAAPGLRQPFHAGYYAMYSSVLDAIVTEPALMVLPIDDHMVHRADGVFETFKSVGGRIYNMGAHLERLAHSASVLGLSLPVTVRRMEEVVVETVRAGGRRDCVIRLFVSRGPGSFGVNPYDCPQPQLYVTVYALPAPFMDRHPEGARLCTSQVPAKSPLLAGVKSCDYLVNVLMKKEAVEAGADFAVGFDSRGFVTEGATENIGIVDDRNGLLFPNLNGILCGTTMVRVMDLAQRLQREGTLSRIAFTDISRAALSGAREVLVVGTTINVTAATRLDGAPVGGGAPGAVYRALSGLLAEDMRSNTALLTPVD